MNEQVKGVVDQFRHLSDEGQTAALLEIEMTWKNHYGPMDHGAPPSDRPRLST
jgi:hypothetical protein